MVGAAAGPADDRVPGLRDGPASKYARHENLSATVVAGLRHDDGLIVHRRPPAYCFANSMLTAIACSVPAWGTCCPPATESCPAPRAWTKPAPSHVHTSLAPRLRERWTWFASSSK